MLARMAVRRRYFAAGDTNPSTGPSPLGVLGVNGPVLSDWRLEGKGSTLLLCSPKGTLEQFENIKDSAPQGWLQHVADQRRCLLITGDTLGLERPDPERFDVLLQNGQALAAVIPAQI